MSLIHVSLCGLQIALNITKDFVVHLYFNKNKKNVQAMKIQIYTVLFGYFRYWCWRPY